ncbi:MAG: hypothetical protein WCJ56_08710 [bacterium]
MKTLLLCLLALLPLALASCGSRKTPPPPTSVTVKPPVAAQVATLPEITALRVAPDRILFPIEKFARQMGYELTIDESTKKRTIRNGDREFQYSLDNTAKIKASTGGFDSGISVDRPIIVDGETYFLVYGDLSIAGCKLKITPEKIEITDEVANKTTFMKIADIELKNKLATGSHLVGTSYYFLGGISGGAWKNYDDIWGKKAIGTEYSLTFFRNGIKGGVRRVVTEEKEGGGNESQFRIVQDTSVKTKEQLAREAELDEYGFKKESSPPYDTVFAISDCTWDPYAHPAIRDVAPTAIHKKAAQDFLQQNSIKGTPTIEKVMEADIDNDGIYETIITVSSGLNSERSWGPDTVYTKNEYNLVLYLKDVDGKTTTGIVCGNWYPPATKIGLPMFYTLTDIMDVDGDGQNEVLVNSGYYEGDGYDVMKLVDGVFIEVASAGVGA